MRQPQEILTPAEMAMADAAAPGLGVPGETLMENAGWAVFRAIRARFRPCRVLVLCGPGNNGGDGYVVARRLAREGWPVSVAEIKPGQGIWRGPIVPATPGEAARVDLVVDAVFGAGLNRDLDPAIAAILRAARTIVAIDVPSGLDGATGLVRGFAPNARLTVTFFRLKPGHLLYPGRALCGETVLADIGMPAGVLNAIQPRLFHNGPGLWRQPALADEGHKYSRGHVTVLGGPIMTGAARLAAEAARRSGAGLVTIAAQGSGEIYRGGPPGTLVSEAGVATLLQDPRRRVWVCGPGLSPDLAREAWTRLIAAGRQIVGDADLFSAFAGDPARLRGGAVLTPHEGEFVRVFGPIGPDRIAAARAAAAATGAIVLLKGATTVIASPDGRAALNASAPPWQATAGSGDVLAGIIAGLLAQGSPPWDAALAAAWLHGEAAHAAGPGMIAEDLIPALARGGGDRHRSVAGFNPKPAYDRARYSLARSRIHE